MRSSLQRVLRIRALQEEQSKMELEAQAERLREMDRQFEEAVGRARQSREGSFLSIVGLSSDQWEAGDDLRLAEEAHWELALRTGQQTDALRPAQRHRVDQAREEFLAVRAERMQVETLLDAAAAVERTERERREQRQLDDWFQTQGKKDGRRSEDG